MKTINKLMRFMVLATVLLCSVVVGAKPSIKKNAITQSPMGGFGESACYIDCDGYDVDISEVSGETQLKVRANASAEWEVYTSQDLKDLNIDSWAHVDVFVGGGREGGSTLTMSGGKVKAVYAGRATSVDDDGNPRSKAMGNVTIKVTGGELYYAGVDCRILPIAIDAPTVSIYVTGANILGTKMSKCLRVKNSAGETRSVDNLIVVGNTFIDPTAWIFTPNQYKDFNAFFIQSIDGKTCYIQNKSMVEPFAIPEYIKVKTQSIKSVGGYKENPNYVLDVSNDADRYLFTEGELIGTINNQSKNISLTSCAGYKKPAKWTGEDVKLTHAFTISRAPATCTASGAIKYSCRICGFAASDKLLPLGHNYVDVPAKEATCKSNGYTAHKKCTRCGNLNNFTAIKSLGHDMATETIAEYIRRNLRRLPQDLLKKLETELSETCSGLGTSEKIIYCTKCDEMTYTGGTHTWSRITTDANHNCQNMGAKLYHCSKDGCKAVKAVAYDTYGAHNVTTTAAKDPTCTEDGNLEYHQCSVCKEYFTDDTAVATAENPIIPAQGHDFSIEDGDAITKVLASAATCTEPAHYYYKCSECDAHSETETFTHGDALGHNYQYMNTYTVDVNAPYDGTIDLHCSNCDGDLKYSFDFTNVGLVNITKMPSSKVGEGTFQLQIPKYGVDESYNGNIPTVCDPETDKAYYVMVKEELVDGATVKNNKMINSAAFQTLDAGIKGYNESVPETEPAVFGVLESIDMNDLDGLKSTAVTVDLNGYSLCSVGQYGRPYSSLTLTNGVLAFVDKVENATQMSYFDIKTDAVSYDREITPGSIVTFTLPVAIDISCIDGTVYKFTDYDEGVLKFAPLESNETKANMPYLVKLNPEATKLMKDVYTKDGGISLALGMQPLQFYTVYEGEYEITGAPKREVEHFGSYETLPIASDTQTTYYGYTNGTFVKANTGTVKPYRTAFRYNVLSGASSPARITLRLEGDDITDIVEVDANALMGDDSAVYDLMGRKVKAMEKGRIYINNGKKIIK